MTEERTTTGVYPLLFKFGVLVSGPKFIASVTAHGAALAEQEDGLWWMHGVEPGGIAESGETAPEAYLRFNAAFREFLADVASDCASYEDFVSEVTRLFHQKDEADEARWKEAVEAFRAGKPVEGYFSSLPKHPSAQPRFVSIQQLNRADNFNVGADEKSNIALPIAA